jgi:hypothetical protein
MASIGNVFPVQPGSGPDPVIQILTLKVAVLHQLDGLLQAKTVQEVSEHAGRINQDLLSLEQIKRNNPEAAAATGQMSKLYDDVNRKRGLGARLDRAERDRENIDQFAGNPERALSQLAAGFRMILDDMVKGTYPLWISNARAELSLTLGEIQTWKICPPQPAPEPQPRNARKLENLIDLYYELDD